MTATVRLAQGSRLRLQIVDALGVVVDDVTGDHAARMFASGSHTIPFTCDRIVAHGMYFLRVVADDGTSASSPLRIATPSR